jgi:SAM-dependent methyltransferase
VYYLCNCGTIWHEEPVLTKIFNEEYLKKFREAKFFQEKINQVRRTYLPIIEEHLYGRESFDIGFLFPENIVDMRERGWLADGIDLMKNDYLTGDFESFDFKGRKYDLIIMNHVLASMKNPIEALRKACGLLRGGGLLFLAGPDTNLCLSVKYSEFGHWYPENKTMLTMERTIDECVKAGMEKIPLVSIQNMSKRFMYSNDYHLIMKKGLL